MPLRGAGVRGRREQRLTHLSPTDFACAIKDTIPLTGRLYVSDHYVCFFSNIFGFETRVRARGAPPRPAHARR